MLSLLLDSFSPGDEVVDTQVESTPYFCGETPDTSVGNLTLACPSGTISKIEFASYGTPSGECGSFSVNASCNAGNTTSVVESLCVGKESCRIVEYPTFGDPCYGTYKHLAVQATCSSGGGVSSGTPV